jgi:biotin operon repressor
MSMPKLSPSAVARMTIKIDVSTVLMPLLNAMAQHQGAQQGVSARALAEELGMSARRLRHLVTLAREEGHAICGHPTSGYYMPTSPEELQRCIDFLHERAMHSLMLLGRMKRVALPELLGQLRINQA